MPSDLDERNSYLYAGLSSSKMYSSFQKFLTRRNIWADLKKELMESSGNENRILDIGCGPGGLLMHSDLDIKESLFTGIDPSEEYITTANQLFPEATFHLGTVRQVKLQPESFDFVVPSGVLHHMDDAMAQETLKFAFSALKPRGTVITVDPVILPRQNPVARILALLDRGKYVRTPQAMAKLWQSSWSTGNIGFDIKSGYLPLPYNHIVGVGAKS